MTNSGVVIRSYGDGVHGILPVGAANVLDAAADVDVMVLEVAGGYLSWNVLAGQQLPAAVSYDAELAQEWVWAIYGEPAALALDEGHPVAVEAAPAVPSLAVNARRLAYAHWASRWWPASSLDAIAPLDPTLLAWDIATLNEACESLVDGADAVMPELAELVETVPRASDYALAAGDEERGGLVLARGVGGWDWRRCPPGLVDASERAVSWQVIRDAGVTTVAVSAVAAPGPPADVPAYLRPWARIETGGGVVEAALRWVGGAWIGEAALPSAGSVGRVDVYLPGFGVDADLGSGAIELRREIREFAVARLRNAALADSDDQSPDAPLLAEIEAAAEDSDF
ncbi:hypothetical protein AB0N05_15485 [Nocardia sp. NPDC051030]|uniref:hypothetical protein n=1 Tax=Nocardia sp. NPDC051030 TaxID=3155162 RepID=UPI00341AEC1D